MKNDSFVSAFSLIELMVVVGLFVLLLGGGMVYMNGFKGRQDLGLSRDRLIEKLNLARNLARTGQKVNDRQTAYVEFLLDSSGWVIVNNDIGDSYFSEDVTSGIVDVDTPIGSGDLLFSAHDGKLLVDDDGLRSRGVGESLVISLYSDESQSFESVVIHSSGLIESD